MIDKIRKYFEHLILALTILVVLMISAIVYNTFRINRLIEDKTSDRYTGTQAKKDIAAMKVLINESKQ